jgi:biopolymer transport protein ExbB
MRSLLLALLFILPLSANDSLDDLLKSVEKASISNQKIDDERLEAFLADKSSKEKMLKKAQEELSNEKAYTDELRATIDANEKELAALEEKLKLRVGALGEMFGVVRQMGGDFKASVIDSSTSTYIKGRDDELGKMLETKELPDIESLERLWYLMQEEIIESGKIKQQKLNVINADGNSVDKEITTIGLFSATHDGEFLRYMSSSQKFVFLPTQPSSRYTSVAQDFEQSSEITRAIIDPTRGMILSMFAQKPTISQRVEQGGIVGYVILLLGAFGVILAIYRYIMINRIAKAVDAQLTHLDSPKEDNPLGRVMMVFEKYKSIDLSSFEAKIDEAILKELPKIKKFENILKLIATVSPLLGLLGTVTGMIETFGAITLFGTGDPKLMAGGISQALMTTVLGLVVAIPMLFLYTFVSSASNKIVAILDEQSAGLIVKKIDTEKS